MKISFPNSGLYVITQTEGFSSQTIVSNIAEAIKGGAKVIQYRDKTGLNRLQTAKMLLSTCRALDVPLIINDDVDLAIKLEADGVHLGKTDCDIHRARSMLGDNAIIGVSCYSSPQRAILAERQGASYVAFGRFFPSKSKPQAAYVSIDVLRRVSLKIPVVAIGGITPRNGKKLLEAGANLLAVIDAVCGQQNPKLAAMQFQKLF